MPAVIEQVERMSVSDKMRFAYDLGALDEAEGRLR